MRVSEKGKAMPIIAGKNEGQADNIFSPVSLKNTAFKNL